MDYNVGLLRENEDVSGDPSQQLTGFQQWMVNHRTVDKSQLVDVPLDQQFRLASRLYNEAEQNEDSSDDFYRDTDFHDFQVDSLVRWRGISVHWFLNIFCRTKYMQRLVEFGCELWFVRKVCIIEMLRRCGVQGGPLVDHMGVFGSNKQITAELAGKPTAFLSYTGRYTIGYFVEALESLKGEYIWMDIFCVDQFAWTLQSDAPEMVVFRDQLVDDLQLNVQRIGYTVLLLERWDCLMYTLNQIWVLWELFNTATVKAKLTVLLPRDERNRFLQDVLEGKVALIMGSLSEINCVDALAANENDRLAILKRFHKQGLYEASCIATESIRDWICVYGEGIASFSLRQLDGQPSSFEEEEKKDILVLVLNIAVVLDYQGRHRREAEQFFRCSLSGHTAIFGKENSNALKAMFDLGVFLLEHGEQKEAKVLLEEAYCIRLRLHGPKHPDVLDSLHGLARLEHDAGNYGKACMMLQEELAVRRRLDHDENTNGLLLCMSNLSRTFMAQGEYEKAEKLMRESETIRRNLYGPEHPETLRSTISLAQLLMLQGNLNDAEQLFVVAYDRQRRVLGPCHRDTLRTIEVICQLFMRKGDHGSAEELLRYLILTLQKIRGNRHPDTLQALFDLSFVLLRIGVLDEARILAQEVNSVGCEVLGEDHPLVLKSAKLISLTTELVMKMRCAGGVVLSLVVGILVWTILQRRRKF